MFKTVRIAILLFILALVAVGAWRTQKNAVQWKYTLPVNVYPINGDGSAAAQAYIGSLRVDEFKPMEVFMQAQALRYGVVSMAPIELRLGSPLLSPPSSPPMGGPVVSVMWWSLHMRWWAWRHAPIKEPGPQVRIFMLYFDPVQTHKLDHSTALQKGLLGRVNLFASKDMASQNNIVLVHELLHTLGASDKYSLGTGQPDFPQGYAQPELQPLLPQRIAEVMAGRVPLTPTQSQMPASLDWVLIGPGTAREINWLGPAAP